VPTSTSGQTRTPPHFKWLLNERAMLVGEVRRRETRIQRLSCEAAHLHGRISALDSAMALFDARVDPRAGGTVNAIGDRYGGQGGLTRFLLAQVTQAGAQGTDTVTLTVRAAACFGIVLDSIADRNTYRDTISWTLRDLRRKGIIENGVVSRGGHTPSTWRLKCQTSLQDLVAKAKTIEGSGHG
jgi:hypothetical protein